MSVPREEKVEVAASDETTASIGDHRNGTVTWPYRIGNLDNSDDDDFPVDYVFDHEEPFTITETTTMNYAKIENASNEGATMIQDDDRPDLTALIDSEIALDDSISSTESDFINEVKYGDNASDAPTPSVGIGGRIADFHSRVQERLELRGRQIEEDQTGATEAAVKASLDEQVKTLSLVESTLSEATVKSVRASKLSVTVVRDNMSVLYGVGLDEMVVETDDGGKWKNYDSYPKTKVFIGRLGENGLLHNSPLEVGDVLKTINRKVMTEYQEAVDFMVSLQGPVTVTVETPQGHPHIVQAYGRKPIPETKVGVQFGLLHTGEHALLQVKGFDSDGLLADCALSAGDLVIAINGTPATNMCPEEATELVESSLVDAINIVVMDSQAASSNTSCHNRSQRWIREAHRVGIALGGGAMVGVGLILNPILPPPFGEILIVGGVSVLGTEFEAPKLVMRSARDSFERAVGRNGDAAAAPTTENNNCPSESTVEGRQNGVLAIDVDPIATMIDEVIEGDLTFDIQTADETCGTNWNANILIEKTANQTESESVKQTTITDHFKYFGRSYILPFLDEVVGDRKGHNATPKTDEGNGGVDQTVGKETESLVAYGEHVGSGRDFNVCDHQDFMTMDDYLLNLIDDAINGELDLE